MPLTTRLALLLLTALCINSVVRLGSAAIESLGPAHHDPNAPLAWLAIGALVALPIWLAALIPTRFALLQKCVRGISVLLLSIPTALFTWMAAAQLNSVLHDRGEGLLLLAHTLALTLICITTYVLLLWPELRRLTSR